MLLSFPTWFIHLLTVTEWGVAIWLFWRYAILIQRRELRIFAMSMTPHLFGGTFILLFHFGNDTQPFLLDLARLMTFSGSFLLLAATLAMRFESWSNLIWRSVPIGLTIGILLFLMNDCSAILLQIANFWYLLFLVLLIAIYRRDQQLFSPLTIGGFWFLLVFVAVTIFNTHRVTHVYGLPSLSHDDVLHGLSEILLSIANLFIAIGVSLRIKKHINETH